MNKGWISVHRSLLDHPFWGAEKFTKAQAWLDLMLNANHKERRVMIKGRLVIVKRGEQIRSKVTLAKTWKWNERTVTKFLELLKSEGMIEVESTELTTHISICNYDTFQNEAIKSTEHNTEQGTQQTTEALHSTVQTNNNNNNGNNENNVNKKPAPAKKQQVAIVEYPEGLNKEAWLMWIDHRREAKIKKLTPRGESIAIKQLIAMGNHAEQLLIIEKSIGSSYTGLFPLKKQAHSQSQEKGNIMDWVHGEKREEKVIGGTYESK